MVTTDKQGNVIITSKRTKIFNEIQGWLNWFTVTDNIAEAEFFSDLTAQIGRIGKVLFESNESATWQDYRLEVGMLAAVALGMMDYYFGGTYGMSKESAWRDLINDACQQQTEAQRQAGLDQRLWFIVLAVAVGEVIEAYRGNFDSLMRARRALISLAASCVLALEALGSGD